MIVKKIKDVIIIKILDFQNIPNIFFVIVVRFFNLFQILIIVEIFNAWQGGFLTSYDTNPYFLKGKHP